jgi:hypothetical protein
MSTFVTESKPPYDPVALAESLAAAAEKSANLIGEFATRNAGKGRTLPSDELGLGKAFMEVAAQMLANPARLAESQMNLWWDYMNLWQGSMMKMMGGATEPVAIPAQGDKRFKHEDWHEHFLFDYIKQSYLITARWLHDAVANVEGLDEGTKKKVDFFTRQYIDALAPSNFALTNPEVFRETIATGGQNLVKGLTATASLAHCNRVCGLSVQETRATDPRQSRRESCIGWAAMRPAAANWSRGGGTLPARQPNRLPPLPRLQWRFE